MTQTKPKRDFFAVRSPVGRVQGTISAIGIWAVFFGVWILATSLGWVNELLVPSPQKVLAATYDLFVNRGFSSDVLVSVWRVFISFAMACSVAIPLGVAMGTFASIEAIFAPFVSAWLYLPAPSFITILLMWFGTG